MYFAKKICHYFRDTSLPGDFFSHQILSSITKLQRRRRPASEQDNFLSGVKTVQILQFARDNLKKKFLSAPTITKLKIWQRQILSRFLDGPNKICKSSASEPFHIPHHESNPKSRNPETGIRNPESGIENDDRKTHLSNV